MKRRVTIAILATLGTLCVAFYLVRSNSNLLTSYGSIRAENWQTTISMSDKEPGLVIRKQSSGLDLGFISWGSSSKVSPSSWINHEGFFTYVDEAGRIWSYNGKDRSFIYETLPDGSGRAWDLGTWRDDVPMEVSARINK